MVINDICEGYAASMLKLHGVKIEMLVIGSKHRTIRKLNVDPRLLNLVSMLESWTP